MDDRFPATQHLVDQGLFRDSPFTLIDVGCSGGISNIWRVFGKSLRAYAIDPMLAEIEKLGAAETNPNVTYHPGYIGLPDGHPIMSSRRDKSSVGNNPWERLSTAWAMKISSRGSDDNETKVKQNRWPETRLAHPSTRVTLADFIRTNRIDNVDFIKIDIDGDDFYALVSCEETINSSGVIGFMLEVNYCGTDSETDHTFHNTDRFMRKHRFQLLDLTIRRYSRKALPAPFVLPMFAQTTWGAPLQGDAVYIRDLANGSAQACGFASPNIKLLKAAAVCEMFGFPDCAAELLTGYDRQLSEIVDVETLLDLLTPEWNGRKLSYREYLRLFSENPESFYPQSKPQAGIGRSRWNDMLKSSLRCLAHGSNRSVKFRH
jgi:FkbM family methyltransferase